MRSTKKPIELKVRKWVQRIKTINTYLKLLDPNRTRLTDQQIVEHIIAPNIPQSWSKDFRLAKGHLSATTRDAVEILEEIKLAEPKEQKGSNKKRTVKNKETVRVKAKTGGAEETTIRK